jgi:glycosyltransferase involved in cell wall biosynthesis
MNYNDKHTIPLVSVIIANFNNAGYLRQCLDSVICQTYQNKEIVIVDDKSTDGSPSIIKEYEENYPGIMQPLFHADNSGVARTRHDAILASRGAYITTLDADDYFGNAGKLEAEMNLILDYKRRDSKDIIAFSNIILEFPSAERKIQWDPSLIKTGNIINDLIGRTCLIPRDFTMPRLAYFNAGGYDFDIPIYEDWDLKIRLAALHEFHYSGVNGTTYRRHGKGLSSMPGSVHVSFLKKIFEKNKHLADENSISTITMNFEKFINGIPE